MRLQILPSGLSLRDRHRLRSPFSTKTCINLYSVKWDQYSNETYYSEHTPAYVCGAYVCVCMYVCVRVCVWMWACGYVCVHVCVCVHRTHQTMLVTWTRPRCCISITSPSLRVPTSETSLISNHLSPCCHLWVYLLPLVSTLEDAVFKSSLFFTCVCGCGCVCVFVCVSIYVLVDGYMYVYTYVCMHIRICVCVYIYIYIYIYVHI